MKTVKHNKLVLQIYDSIEELPLIRFQKFNKFLMIDAGIGSDINEISNHIGRIKGFIELGKDEGLKSAKQELENLKTSMYLISEGISPKYLAFTALIHSVNGEVITDLSDDSCKKTLTRINQVPVNKIDKWLSILKKKLKMK